MRSCSGSRGAELVRSQVVRVLEHEPAEQQLPVGLQDGRSGWSSTAMHFSPRCSPACRNGITTLSGPSVPKEKAQTRSPASRCTPGTPIAASAIEGPLSVLAYAHHESQGQVHKPTVCDCALMPV